jgi:ATP-binding cassette subfamily B protein
MPNNRFIAQSVFSVLAKSWSLTLLLVVSVVVSIILQLYPAFIMRQIIDENFANGILEGVWRLALAYLLVSAGANVVAVLKVIVTTILGQKILNKIRLFMSQRLSELPMKYFINTPVGDIMSRLTTDVDAINTLFSSGIINVVTDLIKIAGLMAALYILAPQLVLLEIAIIPIIYFFSDYFRKNIYGFEKQVRSCVADIYTFIQEWLRGIKTVKAYSLEKQGERKFRRPLNNHLKAVSSISFYDSWFPCVMQTIKAVVIALSLFFGAKNGTVLSLALSVGTLAAVIDLIGKLFAPIEALAQEFQTIQQAMAGIGRVRDFAKQPVENRPQIEQKIDYSKGMEINNVTFAYEERSVLTSVSIILEPGEKCVIIGRSGAGKTTLMNIVAGLYTPASGIVHVCGVDPYAMLPKERRRLIGIVPQMAQIFDGTIKENITLKDNSITQEEVEIAVKSVGLHQVITQLAKGYDTIIGEGESGLSSGEVQLLSLARAIVSNPKILLLDEPTSGMDAKTEQRIFEAIRFAGHGRTILSISHRLSGIVDADRVCLLVNGKIVESCNTEELSRHNGWYSMYRKIEDARWEMN